MRLIDLASASVAGGDVLQLETQTRSRASSSRCSIWNFQSAQDGVVAIEVGLLATPFFMLIIGIMALGLWGWCHATLDYATQKAARRIMTGTLQANNTTASQFTSNVVCSYLPRAVFDCGKLVVNLVVVNETAEPTGWYNYVNAQQSGMIVPAMSNNATTFCLGAGNSYQVLEVLYPLPIISRYLATPAALAAGYSAIMSTAAFKNEPFQGGAGSGGSC